MCSEFLYLPSENLNPLGAGKHSFYSSQGSVPVNSKKDERWCDQVNTAINPYDMSAWETSAFGYFL